MALFTNEELEAWLQYRVNAPTAAIVEQVVAGWLSSATNLASLPAEPPPALKAWAIELAGIAYENPTSMSDDQTEQLRSAWMDRRRQILLDVREWAKTLSPVEVSAGPLPKGSFPPASPWPQPAACYGPRWSPWRD